MKKFVFLIGAAVLFLLPESLFAQSTEADLEALNNRLNTLEQALDAQKSRSEKWGKIVDKLPKISGFAQFGYTWDDEGDGTSNFNIPYARISLAGNISEAFDYKVQFDFAKAALVDAYLRWKVNPAFNIQLGQFHVPFSLEGPMNPATMETIGSSTPLSAITKLPDTRDLGVDVYGKFLKGKQHYYFEYAVGVFQGEGKNKSDANKSKDVIGRLKFYPMSDLCLSGSYSYGERGADCVVNQRAAAGLEWTPGIDWTIRSEYLWHKQGTGDAAAYADGFYALAMYEIYQWAPVVRYAFYNQKTLGVEQSDYLIGLNYTPCRNVRFQVNYTLSTFSVEGQKNVNTVAALATFMF